MSKLMRFVQLSVVLALMLALGVTVNAQEEVAREDTVIFDIDGKEIRNPDVFNPFVHASFKNEGQHQAGPRSCSHRDMRSHCGLDSHGFDLSRSPSVPVGTAPSCGTAYQKVQLFSSPRRHGTEFAAKCCWR